MKLAGLAIQDVRPTKVKGTAILVVCGALDTIDAMTLADSVYVEVASKPNPLSQRQREALLGLRDGLQVAQIAERMFLSTSTVRCHLKSTYAKLGVNDRAQAVLAAEEEGWL